MAPRRVQIIWTGDTGQTYTMELDASVHEQHDETATITDHPVERGSNVADHLRPDPKSISIEGVISNTPQFLPADHVGGASLVTQKVDVAWQGFDNRATVEGRSKTVGDVTRDVPGLGLLASRVPVPTALLGQIPIGFAEKMNVGRQVEGGADAMNVQTFSQPFDRVRECSTELSRLLNEGVLVKVITTFREYPDMGITAINTARDAGTRNAWRFTIALKQVRFGTTKDEPAPKLPTKKVSKGTKTPEKHEEPPAQRSALKTLIDFITGHQ